MGILKDAGDTIVKYGEIIVNKTEELAKIGKLNLDIKRLQLDQGIAEKDLGKHVINKIDSGAASIDCSEAIVRELHEKVNSQKKKIEEKTAEIEKIKTESKAKLDAKLEKKPENGAR